MNSSSTQGAAIPAASWFERLLAWLSCIWDVFQDIGHVLKYARLPLLITLLVGIALIFVGQGQDLIVIHAERPGFPLLFYLAVIFWALNAWYWSRSILTHVRIPYAETCEKPFFGGRRKRVFWLVGHLPRAIGTGAFLMVAIAQLKAAFGDGLGADEKSTLLWFFATSLGLAIAFYVFTVKRRQWSRAIGSRVVTLGWTQSSPDWLALYEAPRYVEARRLGDLPASVRLNFLILSIVLAVLFFIVTTDLTALSFIGPDVVFLICGSLWIVPGSWILFVSKRGDFPVITIFVLIALAFSPLNDNHAVRQIDDRAPAERLAPEAALTGWLNGQQGRPTLVIVATAGGGSRAAYWTASVLGTIQDLHPGFDDQIFGISGVSGGSVGAAVYRGLLTALPESPAACSSNPPGGYAYRHCARSILRRDFLNPALSAALLPDLVQRFLPWGFLPDRAEGLEQAWEDAWRDAMGQSSHQGLMGGDFFAAWPKGGDEDDRSGLPALFLNGTSVATGKRIVSRQSRCLHQSDRCVRPVLAMAHADPYEHGCEQQRSFPLYRPCWHDASRPSASGSGGHGSDCRRRLFREFRRGHRARSA